MGVAREENQVLEIMGVICGSKSRISNRIDHEDVTIGYSEQFCEEQTTVVLSDNEGMKVRGIRSAIHERLGEGALGGLRFGRLLHLMKLRGSVEMYWSK